MSAQQKSDDKTAAAAGSSGQPSKQQRDIPSLGALDEDDEFEEFEAQDWDDSETTLAHLGGGAAAGKGADAGAAGVGGGASGLSISGEQQGGTGDHLWEDNWDDDDVEDDFGKALRAELEKHSSKGQAMAT